MKIERKRKRIINIGDIRIGGYEPITVQSMTSTLTSDLKSTIKQIRALDSAGCEVIRVSVPDIRSVEALPKLVKSTKRPIVADIHFNSLLAIEAIKAGASGIRINPGNIGSKLRLKEILKIAKDKNCCIRIGVNSGSLDKKYLTREGKVTPKGLAASALECLDFFESLNFFNMKVSIKSSNVFETIDANRILSKSSDYPIHLGVTESGTELFGSIRSSVALGILLSEGIGDTVRVSLSADPVKEVGVAFEILKALGLRKRGVTVIACPTCSRRSFDVAKVALNVEKRLASIKNNLTVAVMGCVVNGPGEASHADIGIAGGKGKSVLFEGGKIIKRLGPAEIEKELVKRAFLLAKSRETNE